MLIQEQFKKPVCYARSFVDFHGDGYQAKCNNTDSFTYSIPFLKPHFSEIHVLQEADV